MIYTSSLATPIGFCVIEGNESHIHSILFSEYDLTESNSNKLCLQAKQELQEYFDGKRVEFTFPIEQKGTSFQQNVWQNLRQIQAGYPISYAQLSRQMQQPLAIRAIASTNGKNQLAIVIPCHRVIGSNGTLVGYAGGLWRKKWLLEHEAKLSGIGQTALAF